MRDLRKTISIWTRIDLIVGSIKLKMFKVIVCALNNSTKIHKIISSILFSFRRINSISIKAILFFYHIYIITRLCLSKIIITFTKWIAFLKLLFALQVWFWDEDFSYSLALFFHHLFKNFDFFMKRILFSLKSNNLLMIKSISTENFIV